MDSIMPVSWQEDDTGPDRKGIIYKPLKIEEKEPEVKVGLRLLGGNYKGTYNFALDIVIPILDSFPYCSACGSSGPGRCSELPL